MGRKVLAAMSGGVDSSVAAYLLKKAGYEVTGVTMCLGIREDGGDRAKCCGPDALEDAGKVCLSLGINHHVLDFADELEKKIIAKFVSEYGRGRTPNPCVDCNRYLKFGTLLEKARAMGFDFLATGHYAGIEEVNGKLCLKRPKDRRKDQSYFLYAIPRDALGSILFPLASLTKEEVRDIAAKNGIPVFDKKESQDLCFVSRKNFQSFIRERTAGVHPGPVLDMKGNMLGRHPGIQFYTIGQRGGLGISSREPLYIVSIDAASNRIVAGGREDLRARGLVAGDINILVDQWPAVPEAKIRYRKKEIRCTVSREKGFLRVVFEHEQEAVTPGQSIVFYDGDTVLGGGVIEHVDTAQP